MSKPNLLCNTENMDQKRWLECRMHGPEGKIEYTVGGSDVSTIFGVNPWTTPLELWRIKKGLLLPDDSTNIYQKEMGHLMEPIVAHWYEKLTGNTVITDTGLYQHADHSYALANLDYRCVDNKTKQEGILECKTTSWHKMSLWSEGAVPVYYEYQVRFYLAVMDLEFADIMCMWGTNPEEDSVIRRIIRDKSLEKIIFDELDSFIDSLRKNNPPNMSGVQPEQALNALARIYGASQPSLPTIEFPQKFEYPLRKIAQLQQENSKLKIMINENEKEINAHSVRIAELMQNHEHGVLETKSDRLCVAFITKKRHLPDRIMLKKNHPVIYNEVLKTSESRKVNVSIERL